LEEHNLVAEHLGEEGHTIHVHTGGQHLFYQEFTHHKDQDPFMNACTREIDFPSGFLWGEVMGFNQWALLNDYPRGTTHPLDQAHADAVQLMLPTFNKLIGEKK
jgi:hypothetical protein